MPYALLFTGCGEDFSASMGSIISPGYPVAYGNNLHCNYTITVADNQFVQLQFVEELFHIEGGGRKAFEHVAITDNSSTSESKARPVLSRPSTGNEYGRFKNVVCCLILTLASFPLRIRSICL